MAVNDLHGTDTCSVGIPDDMDDKITGGTARSLLHDVRFASADMADRSGDDLHRIQNGTMEEQGDNLIRGQYER